MWIADTKPIGKLYKLLCLISGEEIEQQAFRCSLWKTLDERLTVVRKNVPLDCS
jgi:hypothetical protein